MLGNVAMVSAIFIIAWVVQTPGAQVWQSVVSGVLIAKAFDWREASAKRDY
jgi:hypothetical protein